MNIKSQGLLTLFSGICFHFILGSYHMWTRISSYYISYLYYNNNPNIRLNITCFFIPTIRLIYTFNIPIGVYWTAKCGLYSNILISWTLIIVSHCIIIISTNLHLIAFAFILFGIGIGIGYLPIIVNTWHYFPGQNGLILSVLLTAFSASPLMLKLLGDLIINPNKEILNENDLLYSEDISNNVIIFIKIVTMLFVVLGVCTVLLIRPWDCSLTEDVIKKASHNKSKWNSRYIQSKDKNCESHIYNKLDHQLVKYQGENAIPVRNIENENENENRFLHPDFFLEIVDMSQATSWSLAWKSKPFIQLTFIFILSSLFNSLHISSSITFGERKFYSYNFIQITIAIWSYSNSLFRVYWGRLLDTIHFKKVYTFSLFLQIFIFMFNWMSAVTTACTNIIIPYAFYKIFGYQNGGVLFGLCQFIAAVVSFPIPKLISVIKENDIEYLILFLINSLMTILSWITLCFFVEKKFDYELKAKEKLNKTRFATSIASSHSGESMQSL